MIKTNGARQSSTMTINKLSNLHRTISLFFGVFDIRNHSTLAVRMYLSFNRMFEWDAHLLSMWEKELVKSFFFSCVGTFAQLVCPAREKKQRNISFWRSYFIGLYKTFLSLSLWHRRNSTHHSLLTCRWCLQENDDDSKEFFQTSAPYLSRSKSIALANANMVGSFNVVWGYSVYQNEREERSWKKNTLLSAVSLCTALPMSKPIIAICRQYISIGFYLCLLKK